MGKTIFSTMAATFVVITVALTWPAAATQTSTALAICVSRGTDCDVKNKGGGYEICVNNTGGKQCVNCPALTSSKQTCSVAARTGKGTVSGVTEILKGGNLRRAR